MDNFLSWLAASFITFPLLGYIVIYKIMKKIAKEKKSAVLKTFDMGSFLLLFCIHYVSLVVLESSLLGFIGLVSVLVFLMVGIIQKRVSHFSIKLSLKRSWRVAGLLYLIIYIVLFNYGMVVRIMG